MFHVPSCHNPVCSIHHVSQPFILHVLLDLAVGQEPIKFILPQFVSYLGERGVLCVCETVDISVHQSL